jgi:hypothetical protein
MKTGLQKLIETLGFDKPYVPPKMPDCFHPIIQFRVKLMGTIADGYSQRDIWIIDGLKCDTCKSEFVGKWVKR